ncbi:KptA family-domain-containing protein [Mycena epipterygia]|nr:KptA family-domain-containing protein [Mycena epipterygia]
MLPTLFRPRCRNVLPVIIRNYSGPPPNGSTAKKPSPKLKKEREPPEQLRASRELSYLLRHGAKSEGLPIRPDGYVNVGALLRHRSLRGIDFPMLENIVRDDKKSRYHLLYEPGTGTINSWWIRANQGHSMSDISLDMKRISSAKEIPMAVHGTSMSAWKLISKQGLSRMSRNHIHMAQGVSGDVISGMRSSSEVLIFIDVARALEADIKFYLSSNGVVLTPGNDIGYIEPQFFLRVERVKIHADPIPGWEVREDEEEIAENKDDDKEGPVDAVELDPVAANPEEKRKAAREKREKRSIAHSSSIRQLYKTSEGLEMV